MGSGISPPGRWLVEAMDYTRADLALFVITIISVAVLVTYVAFGPDEFTPLRVGNVTPHPHHPTRGCPRFGKL